MPQIVAPGLDGQVSYTQKGLAALNQGNTSKQNWNS